MQTHFSVEYSQRLDEIVYQTYGSLDMFEEILSLNSHLLEKKYLDRGDIVYLIEAKIIPLTEENIQALW